MQPFSATPNSAPLGAIGSWKLPPTIEIEILFLDTLGGGDACLLWAPDHVDPNGELWLIDGGKEGNKKETRTSTNLTPSTPPITLGPSPLPGT